MFAVVLGFIALPLMVTGQSRTVSDDEAAIRAVTLHEIEGWSKFDAVQVASCFTVDTTWQNPFGVRIHSRAELQRFLTNLFQRPGYRSAKETMAPRITDIHILSPTSAVVWSEEKSEGQIDDATGKPMKPRYSHYLEVFTKKDGVWLISDSIIMDEYPRP
jgi:uncharacterized protein (TIGR02246 family)